MTFQSGGASDCSSDKNVGDLILVSGISTGADSGQILFKVSPGIAVTTSDNSLTTMATLTQVSLGVGTIPLTILHVLGASSEIHQIGSATDQLLTSTLYDHNTTLIGRIVYAYTNSARQKYYGMSNEAGDYLNFNTASGTRIALKFNESEIVTITATGLGVFTTSPNIAIGLGGNAARTVGMERYTTNNTAGNNLTVQAGDVISSTTYKNGGDLALSPGVSTGRGRAVTRIKGYTRAISTGTSDNTQFDAAIYDHKVALTDNSAIILATCTLATDSSIAIQIRYTVEVVVTSSHAVQVESGEVPFIVINTNGTVGNNTATKYGNIQAVTTGTLTVTFAISTAASPVIIFNANSSLSSSTGYPRIKIDWFNLSRQAITLG